MKFNKYSPLNGFNLKFIKKIKYIEFKLLNKVENKKLNFTW